MEAFPAEGGGSSGVVEGRDFQRRGGFRRAKRGSFSSAEGGGCVFQRRGWGVPARSREVLSVGDNDNGRKKLTLIEPASSEKIEWFIRFTSCTAGSSGLTPVQCHSNLIGQAGREP